MNSVSLKKEEYVYADAGSVEDVIPDEKDVVFYAVLMEKRKEEAYLVTGNLKHFPVRTYIVTLREMPDIVHEGRE